MQDYDENGSGFRIIVSKTSKGHIYAIHQENGLFFFLFLRFDAFRAASFEPG